MHLTNERHAIVNRSGSTFYVYEKKVHSLYHDGGVTAGGEKIGEIAPNAFYTLLPNTTKDYTAVIVNSITNYEIIFRNEKGQAVHGFIETSVGATSAALPWVKYQEPFHYYNSDGSELVAAATETIGGKTYYVFTVVGSARTYLKPNSDNMGTLPIGTKIATTCSTTGQTYGGYMLFEKKKLAGGSWQSLIAGGSYGFVDLGLSVGCMPSDRPIR